MKAGLWLSMLSLAFLGSAQAALGQAEARAAHGTTLDLLLPAPQEMEAGTGHVVLGPSIRLSLPEKWAGTVDRYLWLLDEVLEARHAGPVAVVKEPSAAVIRVVHKTEGNLPKSGYELTVGDGLIELAAADSEGAFNGLATLAQLIELCGGETIEVRACRIRDWPELSTRAVHIDMTCQQYKAAYVERLMRTLARYKVNALLMEYSGMFPFRQHKAIRRPDAFSEQEIQAIRRTAEECHQEIIPFLQCAGHLEYVLTQDPTGIRLSQGHDGYCYCLAKEGVSPFAESLIDEILAQHPGLKRLHVGGDEVNAGTCQRCADAGNFRAMYLKHYAHIADYCHKRGIAPLMWTDVMAPFELRNQPDALAGKIREAAKVLPHEVVGVDWWYGSGDFLVASKLRAAGLQAFTASAARCGGSDLLDLPRVALHAENIRAGCLQAVASTMLGTIITSWSYRGSPHEVCLPEYACAAYAWNTREADVPTLLGRFFRQRYALSEAEGAALAQAALLETAVRIPTIEAGRLYWDRAERTWTLPPERQAGQLISRISKEEPARLAASLESQIRMFARNDGLWHSALRSAKRRQSELRSWDLSRRHLEHRLELSLALTRLTSGAKVEDQLRSLAQARNTLRAEWKELYRDAFTTLHRNVELDIRFDVEPGIIEAVRQWERTSVTAHGDCPDLRGEARENGTVPFGGPNSLGGTAAPVVQRITFDGFAANEVYPADINHDGRSNS